MGDDRLGAGGIPREIKPHWLEAMQGLPRQVMRPLRDACDCRRTLPHRRARLDEAVYELGHYERSLRVWSNSVDEMMRARGVENVDHLNPLQAQAFLARLTDSGQRALKKRIRVGSAIAYARMAIERIQWELDNE